MVGNKKLKLKEIPIKGRKEGRKQEANRKGLKIIDLKLVEKLWGLRRVEEWNGL